MSLNSIQVKTSATAPASFAYFHPATTEYAILRNTSAVSIDYTTDAGSTVSEIAAGAYKLLALEGDTAEVGIRRTDQNAASVNVVIGYGFNADDIDVIVSQPTPSATAAAAQAAAQATAAAAAATAAAVAGHDTSANAHLNMVCFTQSIVESKVTAATGTGFSTGGTMTALRTNSGAGTYAVSLPWIPLNKNAYPYITALDADFDLSLWVSRTTVNADDAFRFGYGKTTAAAVGAWAVKGFGFSIAAGALTGFTHDGATLESVPLIADIGGTQKYYTLRMSGGVVSWLVNGVVLGTSARALTGTTNDGVFRIELEGTAGTSRYDFANHIIRYSL